MAVGIVYIDFALEKEKKVLIDMERACLRKIGPDTSFKGFPYGIYFFLLLFFFNRLFSLRNHQVFPSRKHVLFSRKGPRRANPAEDTAFGKTNC